MTATARPTGRKIVLTFAFYLTIAYCLALAGLALGQRRLIYPVWAAEAYGVGQVPLGTQRVPVATADGETLLGIWAPPAPGKPVVVTFHGNASSPFPHAGRFMSHVWRSNGWGMLAVAFRGYPGSTGSPSESGLLADGEAAFRFARSAAPDSRILLHGHSLGAAVAIELAGRHDVLGVYVEAPFSSLVDMVRYRMVGVPTLLLRDTFRSDERISSVKSPVVVVHGDDDPIVPIEQGRRLASLAPKSTFIVAKGADHVSLFGGRDVEVEEMFRNSLSIAK